MQPIFGNLVKAGLNKVNKLALTCVAALGYDLGKLARRGDEIIRVKGFKAWLAIIES